jgi:hypothetical protein
MGNQQRGEEGKVWVKVNKQVSEGCLFFYPEDEGDIFLRNVG